MPTADPHGQERRRRRHHRSALGDELYSEDVRHRPMDEQRPRRAPGAGALASGSGLERRAASKRPLEETGLPSALSQARAPSPVQKLARVEASAQAAQAAPVESLSESELSESSYSLVAVVPAPATNAALDSTVPEGMSEAVALGATEAPPGELGMDEMVPQSQPRLTGLAALPDDLSDSDGSDSVNYGGASPESPDSPEPSDMANTAAGAVQRPPGPLAALFGQSRGASAEPSPGRATWEEDRGCSPPSAHSGSEADAQTQTISLRTQALKERLAQKWQGKAVAPALPASTTERIRRI